MLIVDSSKVVSFVYSLIITGFEGKVNRVCDTSPTGTRKGERKLSLSYYEEKIERTRWNNRLSLPFNEGVTESNHSSE